MSERRPDKAKATLEVSSQSILDELTAIKDRLSALETIQSISNAAVVQAYVKEHIKTPVARALMKECEQARSRSYLVSSLEFKSPQALDHHLKPLRDADLLRQTVGEDGITVVEWTHLFRRLPKATIRSILSESQ